MQPSAVVVTRGHLGLPCTQEPMNGIVQCGHFIIIIPYRLFIPKGLWKDIKRACYSMPQSSSLSSRVTIVRTLSS